jgi:hypothetical protein
MFVRVIQYRRLRPLGGKISLARQTDRPHGAGTALGRAYMLVVFGALPFAERHLWLHPINGWGAGGASRLYSEHYARSLSFLGPSGCMADAMRGA